MSTPRWSLVPLDRTPSMPWRNGGGTTRELLAWPGPEAWQLRVSVAEVARGGPFSCFAGVQRWFAVLEGAGVQLDVAGVRNTLDAHSAPLCFDGGLPVQCHLIDGPTQDFNLMLQGRRGALARVPHALQRQASAMTFVAAYAGAAPAAARFASEDPVELPPRTLAWRILAAPGMLQAMGDDLLWMESPA